MKPQHKIRAWLFLGIVFIILGLAGWFLVQPVQNWWSHRQQKSTSPVNVAITSFYVDHVIDGDTVQIKTLTSRQSVRIIGIDTPELSGTTGKKECFADEATAHLKELIGSSSIETALDSQSRAVDRYGRLLRYVAVDGKDIGAEMISDGYAYAYLAFAFDRSEQYKALEQEARTAQRGLWASATCGGQR